MTRKEEYEIVEKFIEVLYPVADCGIFDSRNIVGDPMKNVFDGEHFQLDICVHYSYFEVFGMKPKEFEKLKTFYKKLKEEKDGKSM